MRRGMNSMELQKNNRILVLKTLQEKGILYRQGSRKKGEWIIVEPKEMKL